VPPARERHHRDRVRLTEATTFPVEFVCECGLLACTGVVVLTLAEYSSLQTQDGCFAVRLDHRSPAGEELVSEQAGYAVARRLA